MVAKKNKKVSSAFIKMGYIYNKEYVGSFQYDPIEGKQQRKEMLDRLESSILSGLKDTRYKLLKRGNNITVVFNIGNQIIVINFDTINSIVNKNKDRMICGKSYFPFDRSMDKYNSIYVSVEATNSTEDTSIFVDAILKLILTCMNKIESIYQFKTMGIGVFM